MKTTKQKALALRKLIREQVQETLRQRINENSDSELAKLEQLLSAAVKQAERYGKQVAMEQETDTGDPNPTGGNDITQYLYQIYAGAMTGNRKDASENDAIFK